jgi:hypothetical protein
MRVLDITALESKGKDLPIEAIFESSDEPGKSLLGGIPAENFVAAYSPAAQVGIKKDAAVPEVAEINVLTDQAMAGFGWQIFHFSAKSLAKGLEGLEESAVDTGLRVELATVIALPDLATVDHLGGESRQHGTEAPQSLRCIQQPLLSVLSMPRVAIGETAIETHLVREDDHQEWNDPQVPDTPVKMACRRLGLLLSLGGRSLCHTDSDLAVPEGFTRRRLRLKCIDSVQASGPGFSQETGPLGRSLPEDAVLSQIVKMW